MNISKSIYNILKSDATVLSLVSTKIYPLRTPQAIALPFLVYAIDSIDPTDTKDGASTLDIIDFDVRCYADTHAELSTLSEAVRDALDRYSGTDQSNIIQTIVYQNEADGYDNDSQTYYINLSFNLRLQK